LSADFKGLMLGIQRQAFMGEVLELQDTMLQDALNDGAPGRETHIKPEEIVGKHKEDEVMLGIGKLTVEFVAYNEVAGMTPSESIWRGQYDGVLIGELRVRGGSFIDENWNREEQGDESIDVSIFAYSDGSVENFSEYEGVFESVKPGKPTLKEEVAKYLGQLNFPADFIAKLLDKNNDYVTEDGFLDQSEIADLANGINKLD